jgi:hypothetical protein
VFGRVVVVESVVAVDPSVVVVEQASGSLVDVVDVVDVVVEHSSGSVVEVVELELVPPRLSSPARNVEDAELDGASTCAPRTSTG